METAIDIQGLSKSYAGIPAVRDLTITVRRGEVFGLLGTNGAGKSTTIECLLGTKKPDSGTVRLLGADPRKDRTTLFEKVGVQFQDAQYQDRITVRELCESTQALYRRPADYRPLLHRFGLSEKAKCPVSELSGGLRQRLWIVLALLPDPEVVFLDELTTGLDTKARRDVWRGLAQRKQQGLTVFLTSHYMDEVETLCDTICILKQGRSVFSGTVAQAVAASPYTTLEDAYLWFTEEEEDTDVESL